MNKKLNRHLVSFEKYVRKYYRNFRRWLKKNKPKIRHYSWHIFLGIIEASGVVLGALIIVMAYLWNSTPPAELRKREIAQTTTIYDRTGEHLLYEIHGEYDRKLISHEEIPNTIRKAVIATEDSDFYSHFGIDLQSIIRAAKVNYERGGTFQGASTITQQLARSAFLTREKNIIRKINEVVLALKIERRYTKDEILDFYLNEISFGANAYGVQSAAETFFGKTASELDLSESALLAAVIKAPSYYSPYGNHKEELVFRQRQTIERMAELGLITWAEREQSLARDILSDVRIFRQNIEAPHFVFYVKEWMEGKLGAEELESGGLEVITTLDWEMQKKAEEVVREAVALNQKKYQAENASLVVEDPETGEILAMVGSRDYFDPAIDGQVNVAVRNRQPGSAFKPVIYAAAFEKGYQPETLLYDVRTNFGPDGSGKDYIPRNYNGQFSGLVSMREALARSLNIPAVKALYLVGVDDAIEMAERLGINTLVRRDQYGLSLALGGGEMKLLELTGAFSVFANDGVMSDPHAVRLIRSGGNEVYSALGSAASKRVLDEQIARKVSSVLSDNQARSAIFGPASPLHLPGKSVAVKTGTHQENRDGWTVGYSPHIAVGVWVGNNDNSPMKAGADGVYVAAPIWNKFMKWALERYPNDAFPDYTRVASDKTMLTGKIDGKMVYYRKGKKISEKKIKKYAPEEISVGIKGDGSNDLLSFVNREDPLGILPPDFEDPMVRRWNEGVKEYFDDKDDDDDD